MAAGTPEGWHSLTPRIVTADPAGLVEFLRLAFGATGEYRTGSPSVLRIGDSLLMVSGAGARPATPAFLYLYLPDVDAAYQHALRHGAQSLEEPRDLPYGDRRAMVDDPHGNVWQIATHRQDANLAPSAEAAGPRAVTGAPDVSSAFLVASGLLVDEITGTQVRGRLEVGPAHHTPWGIVHGGVYATAVESTASLGASAAVEHLGQVAVGISNTTHFLRSIESGVLRVSATALYQGRTHQLWRVDIDNDSGRLVAHGEVRLQNIVGTAPPAQPPRYKSLHWEAATPARARLSRWRERFA